MAVAAVNAAESVPYDITFRSQSLLQDGWSQQDKNGDKSWGMNGAGAFIHQTGGVANDDYLVSPAITLEAGKTYEVSVAWDMNNNFNVEGRNVEVVYGQGDDAATFTSAGAIDVVGEETTTVQFTVDAAGDYYVALHDTSTGNGIDGTYASSFAIAEVEGGGGDTPAATLPYSVNWIDGSVSDLAGWSAYSVAGESEFIYNAMPEYEVWFGAECAGTIGGASVEVDDYLISPMMPFEAGKNYKITVTLNYNNAQDIDVMYGTSLDDTGWTSIGKLENCAAEAVNELVFTANGESRIAIHAVSNGESCQIAAVSIEETDEQPGGGDDGDDEELQGLAVPQDWAFSSTLADWTVENLDDSGSTGEWSQGSNGVVCSQYDHGTYFASPLIILEAGKTYKLTAVWSGNTYTYEQDVPHVITAVYGQGDDVTAYATAGNIGVANGGGEYSVNITVEKTGDYRVALRNESSTYYGTAYLQSISIAEDGEGGGDTPVAITLPYTKNFATDLEDWTTYNANGDSYEWTVWGGTGVMIMNYGMTANDDYLISPAISFEAGKYYKINVTKQINAAPDTSDNIEVYTGQGDDVSTYTKVGALEMTNGVVDEVKFSFAKSGEYKVALRNLCKGYSMWIITEVTIDETVGGGDEPEPEPGTPLLDKDFVAEPDLDDWAVFNTNGGSEWSVTDDFEGAALTQSMGSAQDDWLISPVMTLEGGKSYVVSYAISSIGSMAPEAIEVAFGTAQTAEGMTEVIGTESFNGDEVAKYYRYTPAEDGTYYLGFHATSEAFNGTIIISRVSVKESAGITPLAPTGLVAEPSIKDGTVALRWTNPTMDTENIALTGAITLRISRNGEQVDEIQGQPGAEMSYIDRPTPFEGEAAYQVQAYVTAEKIGEAAEATASLDDFQGERKLLEGWGATRNADYETVPYSPFSEWTEQHTGSYSFTNQTWDADGGYPWMVSYCTGGAWIISPAVELTADRRYEITATFRGGYNGNGADFEIYYGTAAQISAMTNKLYETGRVTLDPSSGLDSWQNFTTDQFAVAEDGTYYFAIQCTSANTSSYAQAFLLYYYENTEAGPVDAPYVNDFAAGDLAGWSLPAGTTFAVADEALTSTSAGAERNETVYSPLVNMKGGYTYEVSFDYAYSGTGDFKFCMATGQSSAELLTDSVITLGGDVEGRYLFTPAEDGSYCVAWTLTTTADDDASATIDNVAIGAKMYAPLPYSEDFTAMSINSTPTGYEGMTVVSEADGNLAAEVSMMGGSTPWFNYTELRETYTLTMKVKKSDYSGWDVTAVNAEGEELTVASIEGDGGQWQEVSYQIPVFDSEEPYSFRLQFSTMGEGTLQIDDIEITQNQRDIIPGAPLNFRVYAGTGMMAFQYPVAEADGYPLELGTEVTVTFYEGDKLLTSVTGQVNGFTTGVAEGVTIDITDEWPNDTKLFRAVASINGKEGGAATWVLRKNDGDNPAYGHPEFEFDGNILKVADFDFSDASAWTNDGWTIADGIAAITEGEGTITSPSFDVEEGQIYMVRYYIATSASAPADFTVAVGDDKQVFTGAYIGKNTFDWNIPGYALGNFLYIDFMLPRIEAAGSRNVAITASNIGEGVSVEKVEVYEVREYPAEVAVPYENDFDDPAVEAGTFEPNWAVPFYTNYWRIDTVANYADGMTAVSGSRALIAPPTTELDVTGSPVDFIYTPYVRVEGGKAYVVEFDYLMPSAYTGLAFLNANEPTYTEGEYAAVELPQATQWTHQTINLGTSSASGTTVFGFMAYAAEVRDQLIAIDNFKISETTASAISDFAAGATSVRYSDGKLMIPADVASTMVYDLQGRMVMNTTETGIVSLDGLTDGVYVVKATKADGTAETLKIVK